MRPLRQVTAIEQHDGIRRRRAKRCARRHDGRMRPRRVVHVERQSRQHRRVREAVIRSGSGRYWLLGRRLRKQDKAGREAKSQRTEQGDARNGR